MTDEKESAELINETGSGLFNVGQKVVEYPLDKYIVKVLLTERNEFLGILEISINQDFLSNRQRIIHVDSFDVEEFYPK